MIERTSDSKGEVMSRHWGEDWGDNYPHRDITEAIILAAIRVQIVLGPGLLENAYKVCLAHELRLALPLPAGDPSTRNREAGHRAKTRVSPGFHVLNGYCG